MASITARNCHKVAAVEKVTQVSDDVLGNYTRKVRIALRSDGKVLHAIDHLDGRYTADYCERERLVLSRCWNRGGYSIIANLGKGPNVLAEPGTVTPLSKFLAWAERNGYVQTYGPSI
jgi:hypothetical protein